MLSDGTSEEVFDGMVRKTIGRRLDGLDGEGLLDVLGFLIQRERRARQAEPPPGLYPIA